MNTALFSRMFRVALIMSTIALAAGQPRAFGGPVISPGYDLFETGPAVGKVTLDGGFFGPGSDPFEGTVSLKGQPIGPGTTDTIVRRMGGLPPGGTGVIPIELVELSLVSVAPITITGVPYDVTVTENLPSPPGTMTVTAHTDPLGGTFDSVLPVRAVMTFTEVGNPLNTFQMPFLDTFRSFGAPWSHTAPVDYPTALSLPSGNFVPGVDPGTNARVLISEQASFLFSLTWQPAELAPIHEPAALGLIGVALLAMKKRRS